jgi:hypothetical protein
MTNWQTMDNAPKSTSTPCPGGNHVRGIYILGLMPDDALDPESCVDVIWWEPHENNEQGCWVSNTETNIHPVLWTHIPALPDNVKGID